MKTIIASLAIAVVAAVAIFSVAKTEAQAAGLSGSTIFADRAGAGDGYIAVDYNTYFYTHKPGSTPPTYNGNNPNGDQTRSNRPNEQPPTTCTNVRVDNRSGPPTWKQVCRTGYF